MCLVLFAWDAHPDYKLIMATNRDEFYNRPATKACFWEELPDVLAGRDLKAGGTWLGVNKKGKFTAITNYRTFGQERANARSRGELPLKYLKGPHNPLGYLEKIAPQSTEYNGFNLLVGNLNGLYYYSNKSNETERLQPGVYGLSNALLNTPWPKVKTGKKRLENIVFNTGWEAQDLLDMLHNVEYADTNELPQTGLSLKMEQALSPMFIKTDGYGTVSSNVLLISHDGDVEFAERVYAHRSGIIKESNFGFKVI